MTLSDFAFNFNLRRYTPENSATAAAAGGPSEQLSSASAVRRAAAGQVKAKAPSATGELILNADNFGAWFGAQRSKAAPGGTPPAPPPPPPFVDHTQLCQDVIDGREKTKALNDFRLANFPGHDVSDVKCNRGWKTKDWNAQVWAGVKGGVYTGDESGEDVEWEPYIVHGKAGDSVLSINDVKDDGELFGMSCGVKFPARIREFSDRKYLKPGRVTAHGLTGGTREADVIGVSDYMPV